MHKYKGNWTTVMLICLVILTGACSFCQAAAARETTVTGSTGFYERILKILQSSQKKEEPLPEVKVPEKVYTPIFGMPEVTKEQMVRFIQRNNPQPKLSCTVEELVKTYYEEASIEGIRPDLALAQAILETGFFRFGGDVLPEQNNYAGIGSTGNGNPGEWFSSPQIGVRAHIQHLLVYSSTREPLKPIVDPRYHIVRRLPAYFAQCSTWESLSGKWAIPGANYGQRIVMIVEKAKLTQ